MSDTRAGCIRGLGCPEVRLGALTRWVTPELVGTRWSRVSAEQETGALPAAFMVHFALALFQRDSHDGVAENLTGAIARMSSQIPNKVSFTWAWLRLEPEVRQYVFRALAGALAPQSLAAAHDPIAWSWAAPRQRRRGGKLPQTEGSKKGRL